MKQSILLTLLITFCFAALQAQKKSQKPVAYAITSPLKGHSNWTDVRLVDINTGEEVQAVYQNKQEVQLLNARTGKAIVKKDVADQLQPAKREMFTVQYAKDFQDELQPSKKRVMLVNVDNADALRKLQPDGSIQDQHGAIRRRIVTYSRRVNMDEPFATNSAACAYDKKHERLYYTPMGINQLRYIDLKSNQSIYYFENEAFGAVKGRWDVGNQITRMVIAKDGNGYALSNNAEHLIRFTTGKKAEITDLGALTDDAANGNNSVKSPNSFGGDMIASQNGDLYLITANRAVFKIDLDTKVATYKGNIKGLPRGYSTNGAAVEKETFVIVSSANSTSGYYRFDINTLQAEKVSTSDEVFNASDLANGNLLAEKKKKKEIPVETAGVKGEVTAPTRESISIRESGVNPYKVSAYPNPVTTGRINLSFGDVPRGRYMVQFLDATGKIMSTENVAINFKNQVKEFKLSQLMSKGNYLVKVLGEGNKMVGIEQIVVQ